METDDNAEIFHKDKMNRWRKKTIAFRVSNEENKMIDEMVSMSGMKKQDYLTSNMLQKNIKVTPNVRMLKGLKKTLTSMTDE
ncbi:MAG: plasmid mobilization protein [Prevotella sp.]